MKNLVTLEYYVMLLFAVVSFISIAIGNIFLGLAVLVFLIYAYRNKLIIPDYAKGYFVAVAFFLLTMLLSALFSGDITRGVKTWIDLWIYRFMPFVIILLAFKDSSKVKQVLFASVLGITISILCVIYQGFAGNYRANGFFGNPMTFGGYLCIYLPLLLMFALDMLFKYKYQFVCVIISILGFAALVFNGTRGAWLALILPIIVILGSYMLENKRNLIIGTVVFVMIGVGLSLHQPFVDRLNTITDTTKNQSNIERILIWQSAYSMFQDNPILGVGLGQYKNKYQKEYISPEAKNPGLTHAHNNFMQMLAENGFIGFIGFVAMIGYIILKNITDAWKNRNPYALAIFCSTLALVLQGLTEYNWGNSAVMKAYWLVIGCLVFLEGNKKKV